ncbi:MAG: hypothetical protein R2877_08010 [Bdellovibrionota bacterium]
MDPGTLTVRNIKVFASVPYLLKDYKLNFLHPGHMKGHAFADVNYEPGEEVFGILHKISIFDLWRLDFFELGVFFRRHKRISIRTDNKFFYLYQGTESIPNLKPAKAYYDAICKAYEGSGFKSFSHQKALEKIETLDFLPKERREHVFTKPTKYFPVEWVKAYDRMIGKMIAYLYPHKILGERSGKKSK